MVDPTAITEAPIVAEPLTETQSPEQINVDTPTVETPLTAPTVDMPTALTEGTTPDDQSMDDLQHSQEDHVEQRQETKQEEATHMVPASEPPRYLLQLLRPCRKSL
ncbi:hypothetical protein E4U19_007007 [Claviceps sp. Clav32 group G5]|nr:hypothetical protein E4U19_007007 [Claviceps sp. Clav32 group G5]